MKKISSKWWFWPFFIGVIIRVLVMPTTYHPDFLAQTIASYLFSHKGILNVYDYLINLPGSDPLVRNFSVQYLYIYPPLMYFSQGLLNLLVRPLADFHFIPNAIVNVSSIYALKGLSYHLFIYKLPYLFIDILAAFSLTKIFNEERKKRVTFWLWMLNPVAIYTTFMVGQNDILPVLFTILSVLYLKRDRAVLGMLLLGIAGSFKMYPMLFIIPAALIVDKKLLRRIKLILVGFIPYLLTVGPFLLSRGFRQLVLLNQESQKVLFMKLPVSGAEWLSVFLVLLAFYYFRVYYSKRKLSFNNYSLIILLALFSVTHYHPQWFLWITPFIIIYLVENNLKYLLIFSIILLSWLMITFMFEPSLNYALFTPIIPNLAKAQGLSTLIQKYYDVNIIKSIIRSIFAGASFYFTLDYLKNRNISVT